MRKLVEKLSLKKNNSFLAKGEAKRASVTQTTLSDDIGLKLIYENSQCDIDIVAIHGDGGHYQNSWTHPETKVFWLRDLLPQIVPRSRIMSFGYHASKSSFPATPTQDIALILLTEISELRNGTGSEKRPVIFLAHSFGVMILKGALVDSSSSNFHDIYSFVQGILFFGTPPDISHGLKTLLAISSQEETKESPQTLALRKDAEWLQVIASEYAKLEAAGGFPIVYFLESPHGEEPRGENLDEEEEKESQSRVIRMGKTHGMMIRFPNAKDGDFRQVEKYLKKITT